jgi:predicted nucleic acid-binding protein
MSASASVIGNAGPLMVLAKLNLLHLLKELYGYVHIVRSVYDEVVIEGMRRGHEDARTLYLFLNQMGWNPDDLDPAAIPADLREIHLDRGERDTLALAIALGGALVLMDETAGRKAARARGLTVRGSLGILIEAHRRGLIEADQLRLYFAEIARRQDIWISQALVERLLQEVLGDC